MFGKVDKNSNRIWLLLLLIVYFVIAYTVMNYYNITCVFLKIFGVPCPGCGMTRAFLSLLKLDLYSAVKYNAVILFMPYVFMYLLFDFKHKMHNVLLSIIAIVAIINWVVKIFLFI